MLTVARIKPYIENKLVSMQEHPFNKDVCIFNYTQKCQYSREWDEVTMRCRGLIIDVSTGKLLANPFPKFFNYGEKMDVVIPDEVPVIAKKYDGSLGILYFLPNDDKPYIATRGSFTSEQALWATDWLRKHVDCSKLMRTMTYLFEIIYPENRIVVNYEWSGLILLAIKHIDAQGHEFNPSLHTHLVPVLSSKPEGYGGNAGDMMRIAERIEPTDLSSLKAMEEANEEGFVIHYPQAELRLKVKFDEYVRLHRLVTGVSAKAVWELMMKGQSFDDLLEKVPDEFYKWVEETRGKIQADYDALLSEVDMEWMTINRTAPVTRADWAACIKRCKYPGLLFTRLDGKDEAEIIWKMVKPKVEQKTFKQDNEL